jgi:hypothetical protein
MGIGVMNKRVTAQIATDIFAFELSDEALERAAASAGGRLLTIGACTHWYHCGWPLSPSERVASWEQSQPAIGAIKLPD